MKNIGIIGFGKMGMLHAGIINALHDSRIVAIAESSDFIRKASKGLMNNISFHRDYQNMIKKPKKSCNSWGLGRSKMSCNLYLFVINYYR